MDNVLPRCRPVQPVLLVCRGSAVSTGVASCCDSPRFDELPLNIDGRCMPSTDLRVVGVCGIDEVDADCIPADLRGSGGAGPFWLDDDEDVRLKKGIEEGPNRFVALVVLLRGTCWPGPTGVTLRSDLVSVSPCVD